jgi:hypothetical protein
MLAALDAVIMLSSIVVLANAGGQEDWNWSRVAWDVFAIGTIRVLTVIGVASSLWLREFGWILGGICGVSLV